ncbi:hypothetical protein GGX14DRAFT_384097 [Mycena pura]|uniref:Uncharacterized protein n=1 Tax=Mycena pura TaxID=153505 RepID=A0AAD6YV53_9AGAR|nr:hypothetical protein GGX14DRAFT_384097 [Mycena pura]
MPVVRFLSAIFPELKRITTSRDGHDNQDPDELDLHGEAIAFHDSWKEVELHLVIYSELVSVFPILIFAFCARRMIPDCKSLELSHDRPPPDIRALKIYTLWTDKFVKFNRSHIARFKQKLSEHHLSYVRFHGLSGWESHAQFLLPEPPSKGDIAPSAQGTQDERLDLLMSSANPVLCKQEKRAHCRSATLAGNVTSRSVARWKRVSHKTLMCRIYCQGVALEECRVDTI